MAMPASGSIAILNNTLQTCSSIAVAVDGNATPPKSLATLSATAGKTAPHGMTEFYGYSAGIDVNVSLTWTGRFNFGDGFNGTVRLMCGFGTTVCSCSFPFITTFGSANWNGVPAGTYCVDFGQIQANVGGVGVVKEQCWCTNTSNGTSNQTNSFSSNQFVDYCIWSTGGGGGPEDPF
jgi:hypothetical protein